jgi:hypothetical protein
MFQCGILAPDQRRRELYREGFNPVGEIANNAAGSAGESG